MYGYNEYCQNVKIKSILASILFGIGLNRTFARSRYINKRFRLISIDFVWISFQYAQNTPQIRYTNYAFAQHWAMICVFFFFFRVSSHFASHPIGIHDGDFYLFFFFIFIPYCILIVANVIHQSLMVNRPKFRSCLWWLK